MTVEKLEKDIKLVQECIAHWDRVIQGVDRPNAQSCSLCREYLNADEGSCKKCPICEETGRTGCHRTPYHEALAEYHMAPSWTTDRKRMRSFLVNLEIKLQRKLSGAKSHLHSEKPDMRISKLDKDIRLLDECIIHWHAVLKGEEEPSGSKCALCREYSELSSCNGCPIQESTGRPACYGTPYYDARMEHRNRSPNTTARNNMINFLTSLQEALLLERHAGVPKKLDYLPAPAKPSIDWKAVAPQYKYLARDKNGRAYLYKDAPFTGAITWLPSRTDPTFNISLTDAFVSYLPGDCDWKDSLVERPEE